MSQMTVVLIVALVALWFRSARKTRARWLEQLNLPGVWDLDDGHSRTISLEMRGTIETKQANGESPAGRSFFLLTVVAKKGVNSDFLTWVELVSTAHNTYARFT